MTDAARIFNNIKAEYFDVQQRIFCKSFKIRYKTTRMGYEFG
jgi:hypothetical protein